MRDFLGCIIGPGILAFLVTGEWKCLIYVPICLLLAFCFLEIHAYCEKEKEAEKERQR